MPDAIEMLTLSIKSAGFMSGDIFCIAEAFDVFALNYGQEVPIEPVLNNFVNALVAVTDATLAGTHWGDIHDSLKAIGGKNG